MGRAGMARRFRRKRAPQVPYAFGIGLLCTLFAMVLNPRAPAASEVIDFSAEPSRYPDFMNDVRAPAIKRARGRRLSDECPVDDDNAETTDDSELLDDYPGWIDEQKHPAPAVLVSIFLMFLMFYGLAVACDEYFSPALEVITAKLDISEDVAGATFMAAGGSAPELATSILGTLVSESDVGIGTIVGSAVFNVLFVIAVCALLGQQNMLLDWYPLGRDCVYYCFSILVLVMFVLDQEVALWEAIILFLLYIVYCLICWKNEDLKKAAKQAAESQRDKKPSWTHSLVIFAFGRTKNTKGTFNCSGWANYFIYLVIIVNTVCTFIDEEEEEWAKVVNHVCNIIYILECIIKNYGFRPVVYWSSGVDAFDGVLVILILVEYLVQADGIAGAFRGLKFFRFLRFLRFLRVVGAAAGVEGTKIESKKTKGGAKVAPYDGDGEADDKGGEADDKGGEANDKGGEANDKEGKDAEKEPADGEEPAAEVLSFLGGEADDKGGKDTDKEPAGGGEVPADAQAADKKPAADGEVPGEAPPADDTDADDGTKKEEPEGEAMVAVEGDPDDGEPFYLWSWPEDARQGIMFVITLPLVILLYYTIPDCRKEEWMRYWPVTFINCIIWIAILAYVMVWQATVFGVVCNIPQPVMGLTLLAAGTSIPDALSSLAMAQKGFGDMAVSSSVGSNIFDILVGLPIPWMLYGAINFPGVVCIKSTSIGIMVMTLFVMVAMVVCGISMCEWKLTKKLGVAFGFLYFLFVAESLLLEYDVIKLE